MLHTKFQKYGPSGSEEEDCWISIYAFLCFEPRTPWRGAILDPETLVWINLVKDHQAVLHTKFQAREPSSSGEEDFEVYFIFEPKTPRRRAISDHRATIWTNLVEVYKEMLHTTYQGPRPSGFSGDVIYSKLLTTDDAWRTLAHGNSSPWAYGSGELKNML